MQNLLLEGLVLFFLPLCYLLYTLDFKHPCFAFRHPKLLNTLHLLSCWLHHAAYCIFGMLVQV